MFSDLANVEPHWAWLAVGLILCGLEMLVPGVFLLWLGVAALLTGLIVLLTGVGSIAQLVLFAILAIVAVTVGRRWYSHRNIVSDDPLLNDRLARLVGEQVIVETAIVAGRGRVRVGDSVWTAEGPDMPAGTTAIVTASHGGALIVEPR